MIVAAALLVGFQVCGAARCEESEDWKCPVEMHFVWMGVRGVVSVGAGISDLFCCQGMLLDRWKSVMMGCCGVLPRESSILYSGKCTFAMTKYKPPLQKPGVWREVNGTPDYVT